MSRICAGPVSFATINELSLINAANWDIFKALLLSNTQSALILDAFLISSGPGAMTTLNLLFNFSLIIEINSL